MFKDLKSLVVKIGNKDSILEILSMTADQIFEKEAAGIVEQKFTELAGEIKDTDLMELYVAGLNIYNQNSKTGLITDQTEED